VITDPSPDIAKYCGLMEEVKLRVNVIDFFISGKGHALYPPPTLESACLQLRKILELVAFGSLVANKDAYTAVYGKFSKKWDAGDLLKELGQVNPYFYPFPIIEVPSTHPPAVVDLVPREGGFLTESNFAEVYGRCGVMAHAANPYGEGIDYAYYRQQLPLWRTQVMNLLNAHEIRLVNTPGLYLIHVPEKQEDRVHWCKTQPWAKPQ
jgi:hypothetical protein